MSTTVPSQPLSDYAFAFDNLQYRQELHDRFFHNDIYVLTKHRRLAHLALHHAKYVSSIYGSLSIFRGNEEEISDIIKDQIKMRSVDGLIICMSMLNICNLRYSDNQVELQRLVGFPIKDQVDIVDLLMRNMGGLAKVVEDIDHLAVNNPLSTIIDRANVMIYAYGSLFTLLGGDVLEMIRAARTRLNKVEMKHIFYEQYKAEMLALIRAGQPDCFITEQKALG